MEINPIKIVGPWDEGYALDTHTISSIYIGDNVYGKPEFDTTYSKIGQLLHMIKYKHRYELLGEIIELAKPFILSWENLKQVNFVIPVPPSKNRVFQPAQEIAREIATLVSAGYSADILEKTSDIESKSLSASHKQEIHGTITKKFMAKKEHSMLLVDDLYKSGTTLYECVRVLREDPKIKNIYVLTMTKTRKG